MLDCRSINLFLGGGSSFFLALAPNLVQLTVNRNPIAGLHNTAFGKQETSTPDQKPEP